MKRILVGLCLGIVCLTTAHSQVPSSPPATPASSASDLANPLESAGGPTPSPGSTVITSDELRMDQNTHTAVFTGNVMAVGTNFNMKCQEMTVNFDKAGKVDTIISKGDVVVNQPGRITHSGEAEYFRDDDKFVLTDQPQINDNGNIIAAPKITIYRTKQSLYTEGPSKVTIPPSSINSNQPKPTQQQ